MHTLFTFVCSFLICILSVRAQSTSTSLVKEFFYENDQHRFNHLVIDKDRGLIYVGAVNRLYQLSPSLDLLVNHTTGPVEDSPECSVLECPPGSVKKPTDNYNKALLIDYKNPRLISCGTVFQGLCTIHNLKNVSDMPYTVRTPVVTNNATASTVAFIAPGPNLFHIGVTSTGNSKVPGVASRSLEDRDMLNVATTGTQISVDNPLRDKYPVNYVFGFSSGSFSYFLTTQMRNTSSSSNISKLVRICHNDSDYYSYTEMQILCSEPKVGTQFDFVQAAFVGKAGSKLAKSLNVRLEDDVLFAVFSTNVKETNTPNEDSALCTYSLPRINQEFGRRIKSCFRTINSLKSVFTSKTRECEWLKRKTSNEGFCGATMKIPQIGGEPFYTVPNYTFKTRSTAVTAMPVGEYTAVFIGTSKGHLKKIKLHDSKAAKEYDDITIDEGIPVNGDLLFDSSESYLYVMTERKVAKVKVENCNASKTCLHCLYGVDPYCVWCIKENRCSAKSDCHESWIPYMTGRCAQITKVTPKELQRYTTRMLELSIENLPPYPGQLYCRFKILQETSTSNATRDQFGVKCNSPNTSLISSIPWDQHYYTTELSLVTDKEFEFAITNFTFFNCNSYASCTSCISSAFPCSWCIVKNHCTHDTLENCENDTLVLGRNQVEQDIQKGPAFCPRIASSTEILIPSGTTKSIRVETHALHRSMLQMPLQCQFNVEGRLTLVKANLTNNTISCEETEFTYAQQKPNIIASFAVLWNVSKVVDNPDNVHITIYQCSYMAKNCYKCLTLDQKYNCGWCWSTNRCDTISRCDNDHWINQDGTCPIPSITSFTPAYGPWEGGTNITIEGVNLGRTFKDIAKAVTVADLPCKPYADMYVKSFKIVCQVNGTGGKLEHHGLIIVKVWDLIATSSRKYHFVNPEIQSISPQYGPLSGGTYISVIGEYMDAGSSIEVWIDNLPCQEVRASPNNVNCITSAAHSEHVGMVSVKFDHATRVYKKSLYEYVEDPKISCMVSGDATVPKGIPSGGINITVCGTNLFSIQNPQFYVYNEKGTKKYSSPCNLLSNTRMTCRSPKIQGINSSLMDGKTPMNLEYGFLMDNVISVQNLSGKGYLPFALYPDPMFESFEENNGDLVIKGRNVNLTCGKADLNVRIGLTRCRVVFLSNDSLICRLPRGYHNSKVPANITVRIGLNFKQNIGSIVFSLDSKQGVWLTKWLLYGFIVITIFIVLVFGWYVFSIAMALK